MPLAAGAEPEALPLAPAREDDIEPPVVDAVDPEPVDVEAPVVGLPLPLMQLRGPTV